MQRNIYLENAFKKYNEDKISEEAYDAILENINAFCDEDVNEDAEFQRELIMEQQEQM